LHCSSGEGETLEERVRTAHRLYLTALMRVEALEGKARPGGGVSEYEATRIDHELQFRLLRALLAQLGYVPRGLTKRCEIQREITAEATVVASRAEGQLDDGGETGPARKVGP
jgi:hypothetical protein